MFLRLLNGSTSAFKSVGASWFTASAMLAVLLAVSHCSAAPESAGTEGKPSLVTLQQFCEMDRSTIVKRETVRVRGTVTFINREWQLVMIQEGRFALKAFLEKDAELKVGQLVELTGRTEFGEELNLMMVTGSKVIGEGSIPEPVRLDETVPFSLDLLYRWSEIEGPIYSAVADDSNYYIYVAGKQFGIFIIQPRSPDLPPVNTLRNYHVHARGIPVMSTEKQRPYRIDMHVPTGTIIELTPNEDPKNGVQLRSLADTGRREMRGDAEAPARFRAVVRSIFPPNRLFLSDESGPLLAELAEPTTASTFNVGDVVEVEGQIDRSRKKAYLRDAHATLLGKGYSEPPSVTVPREGLSKLGQLIRVTGMLVTSNTEKNWLLLRDGGTYFRVRYTPTWKSQLEQAGIGSQISATGGCWISPSDDSAFDVMAREAAILFHVPRPADAPAPSASNETLDSTATDEAAAAAAAAAAPGDIIRPVLMVLLLIFLGILIWLVNRRLKEQERFQESIHEQLSHLSHIARLNTLAEMVGALAHELNQPLASVSNYAATAEILSRKEPADTEKLASVLAHIGKEAFRAGEIIRRLRNLVRRKTPGSLPVQISEIVHETIELFKTQHVTACGLVQVNLTDTLPTVQADSVQIQQVILNLLLNARDATEAEPERVPEIQVESKFENGMVYVSVADNGVGISSPTPDAIFEPYFTTREAGTGLGLAISRTIIETHGGKITAEKRTPYGTRITFSLPVSRAQANIAE